MTQHDLKITPRYFDAVANGAKTFEVRRYDRPYREGDTIRLREWDPERNQYTRRTVKVAITYILMAGDFPEGIINPEYAVLGVRLI